MRGTRCTARVLRMVVRKTNGGNESNMKRVRSLFLQGSSLVLDLAGGAALQAGSSGAVAKD